jgi:hypothetical protein
MNDINTRRLWFRWVVANAVGELIGLGTTFAVGFAVFTILGEPKSIGAVIGMFLLMVTTGAIEGVVIGLSQWLAMRSCFPGMSRRSWVAATLLGALVAWFLGSIPSTVMSLGTENAQATAAEPELFIMLLVAGAMGAVAGVVLALPQSLVLRRAVDKAWWWLPANSAAWFFGMPVIFGAMDLVEKMGNSLQIILTLAITLALTGAIVGGVHGFVLVRLAEKSKEAARKSAHPQQYIPR